MPRLLTLSILLLLAAAVRLDFLAAADFVIDADEAIVGLMAKHIYEGKGVPTFYYGQAYMGSFEAILAAGSFAIFGISNEALLIVPFFFALLLVLLTYGLTREIGGEWAARAAALLMALPPSALVVWSTKARGGFIEIVCLSAAALLTALRWQRSGFPIAWALLTWLLLGFGWWVNNQILYAVLAIALFMTGVALHDALQSRPRLRGKRLALAASAVFGFFAGGAPFWIYNVRHGFPSAALFKGSESADVLAHMQGVVEKALPILFGARRFWSTDDLYPYATVIAYSLFAVPALLFIARRFKQIAALLLLRFSTPAIELPALFVVIALAVFCVSSFGRLVEAPRYLLPLYPALFALIGVVLEWLAERRPLLARGYLSLVVAVFLASSYIGGRGIPGEPFIFDRERVSSSHAELIDWLEAHNIPAVRTNYWVGYRLAFETRERVKFVLFGVPEESRIREWELQFAAHKEELPMVLSPRQGAIVERALGALGYRWQRADLSGYTVLYGLERICPEVEALPAGSLTASASNNNAGAPSAIDGSAETRWGSASPQNPQMEFVLRLSSPQPIRGFHYDLGQWKHDYPRRLKVLLINDNGQESELLSHSDSEAIQYYLELEQPILVCREPQQAAALRFLQQGSDPFFDWSIAELQVVR